MGSRWVNVAGITFRNSDGTSRQFILSEMYGKNCDIYLMDAATSEHPEAIAVYNNKWQQIGFIPKGVAWDIRNKGINIHEIYISDRRCYRWEPRMRRAYGDDEENQGKELFGCKFIIDHPLIKGDAEEYRSRPVRSLRAYWDGEELHRIEGYDDEWDEIEGCDDWDEDDDDDGALLKYWNNSEQKRITLEEAKRMQQNKIERELAEIKRQRQYMRQAMHDSITFLLIAFILIVLTAAFIYGHGPV